jgi:hypothetical protein
MKYSVGDLVLVKDYKYKPRRRPLWRYRPVRPHLPLRRELLNSFGIITKVEKHSDAWEGETTNDDNVYVWFSQLDAKEYDFCENEVDGEIIK